MSEELKQAIKELVLRAGYVACGIIRAEPFVEYQRALGERIARFPEAAPLYEELRPRVDPQSKAPWVRSIVVCVRRYGKYILPQEAVGHIGRNYLGDRRFEGCADHAISDVVRDGLKALGLRIRKGGVPDRWAGARAGVTRFGRNCFAYAGRYGSWVNIESWRVDAELPPDEPTLTPACPPDCRACIKACPTGALSEPFVMRMDRCIAYLTYYAPHPIVPARWEKMGPWIYGCDVCQEVCPLNRGAWEPLEEAGWQMAVAEHLSPAALATMSAEVYREIIHPRFPYIPLEDLERWHVNARRALAYLASRNTVHH